MADFLRCCVWVGAAVLTGGIVACAHHPAPNPVVAHPHSKKGPYPFVFVYGFFGFIDLGPLQLFHGVEEDLKKWDVETYFPVLPSFQTPKQRARILAQYIDDLLDETGYEKVHIIGYSQGGIDARYMISAMGYGDKVASLTTVAAPHRGTPLADIASRAPHGTFTAAGQFVGWFLTALDDPSLLAADETAWRGPLAEAWEADADASIYGLSRQAMTAFNRKYLDDARVPIFSVATVSNLASLDTDLCRDGVWDIPKGIDPIDPILLTTGFFLSHSGFDGSDKITLNDGFIPTSSAKWGTFLGCVPADHFDVVGQFFDTQNSFLGEFDHRRLYRMLVQNARSVENQPASTHSPSDSCPSHLVSAPCQPACTNHSLNLPDVIY